MNHACKYVTHFIEAEIIAMALKCGGLAIGKEEINAMRLAAVKAFEALESAWKDVDVTLVDFKVELMRCL